MRKTIDKLIDRERFNAEVQQMKEEGRELIVWRSAVQGLLKNGLKD